LHFIILTKKNGDINQNEPNVDQNVDMFCVEKEVQNVEVDTNLGKKNDQGKFNS